MTIHVLLTDGFQRKTLAAVRGLGKAGLNVAVGESTRLAASLFSRWARHTVTYPAPAHEERRFIGSLRKICDRLQPEVLMAMEEETLLAVLRHRDEFEPQVRIPFAPIGKILLARDKLHTHRLAERLGIPVPELYSESEAAFPAVLKPRVGSGSRGRIYCDTPKELKEAAASVRSRYGEILVQERLPGRGEAVCVSMLFDSHHRAVCQFTHRRLREYPVDGGPSTLRESIRLPEVEQHARKLLESLDWVGVASVEFKKDDRDGVYKFLEINPRFWGSLNLAVKAGANFPYYLYCMAVGREFERPLYRVGVRSSWLIPGDVLHFLHAPNRWAWIREWLDGKGKGVHDDFAEGGDLAPAAGALASSAAMVFQPEFRRFLRG